MRTLVQDFRYAGRMLLRNPGFALVAIATLALGIGANSAIFSVVNSVLLRPLPYKHPEQLVRITADYKALNLKDVGASPGEARDYEDRTGAFQGVSGLWPIDANLTETDRPERVEALATDFNYFQVLQSSPALGRVYTQQDYQPGFAPVAVISSGLWERRFGNDPHVLGKKIRLDNDLYEIIGVMPRGFAHPGGGLRGAVDIWICAGWKANPFTPQLWRQRVFSGLIARLKPGVTVEQAQQKIEALSPEFRKEFPQAYPDRQGWTPRVTALQQDLAGPVRTSLVVLMSAVALVLLIACVNVANLLLVRASGRNRELAIRAALGACRRRLIQQLLAESVLLSVTGGAAGILVAGASIPVLMRFSPPEVGRVAVVSVDGFVLVFTIAISVAAGVLFGLVPALQASRTTVQDALKEGTRGSSGLQGGRVRNVLVVSELALAVVLLVSASLLIRSFWRLQQVNPGFDKQHTVAANVWLPAPNDPSSSPYNKPQDRAVFFREIVRRVSEIPGIDSAALITGLPLSGLRSNAPITIENRSATSDDALLSPIELVSGGYFKTMRIPLNAGRDFNDGDTVDADQVAIVSQAFVRKFFPTENPIGKRFTVGRPGPTTKWNTIVGVVGNVKEDKLESEDHPLVYRPVSQLSSLSFSIVVRTRADVAVAQVGGEITKAVQAVDPNLPVFLVRSMQDIMRQAESQRRFAMMLLGLFAVVALALASIGVYGVVSYAVGQRTREIGIRLAIGATRADILRLVIGQGIVLAMAGVGVGLLGSAFLTRLLHDFLFGVSATDLATYASAPLMLAAIALLATWWPARRASRVDPLIALRYE